ncbi:hypothetical protein B0H63DRAFT_445421 [Podospora didyma]|uniref:Protein kinase domain-containing protein n=1 Tax=Podospora didyma TaxID=330526 RepID=A0AAE0NWP8_9PEZI|nr:hypothetical protein B0H63DRAFT_445421 [Podospora didyma]
MSQPTKAEIDINIIPNEDLKTVDWQQKAGLVSELDRDAAISNWAGLDKSSSSSQLPMPSFQEKSTLGTLNTTRRVTIDLNPIYAPMGMAKKPVSVWGVTYLDINTSKLKDGVLKLVHPDGDPERSLQEAKREHGQMWLVWTKIRLVSPQAKVLPMASPADTALVMLDKNQFKDIKHPVFSQNPKFQQQPLYGIFMPRYGRDLQNAKQPKFSKWPEAEVLKVLSSVGSALQAFHLAGRVHGDVKDVNVVLDNDNYLLIDYGDAKASGSVDVAQSTDYIPTADKNPEWRMASEIFYSPQVDRMMLLFMCCAMLAGIDPRGVDARPLGIAKAVADVKDSGLKKGLVQLILDKGETTLSDSFLQARICNIISSVASGKDMAPFEAVINVLPPSGNTKPIDFTVRGIPIRMQAEGLKNIATAMSNSRGVATEYELALHLGLTTRFALDFLKTRRSITVKKDGQSKTFLVQGKPGIRAENVKEIGIFIAKSAGL